MRYAEDRIILPLPPGRDAVSKKEAARWRASASSACVSWLGAIGPGDAERGGRPQLDHGADAGEDEHVGRADGHERYVSFALGTPR